MTKADIYNLLTAGIELVKNKGVLSIWLRK